MYKPYIFAHCESCERAGERILSLPIPISPRGPGSLFPWALCVVDCRLARRCLLSSKLQLLQDVGISGIRGPWHPQ